MIQQSLLQVMDNFLRDQIPHFHMQMTSAPSFPAGEYPYICISVSRDIGEHVAAQKNCGVFTVICDIIKSFLGRPVYSDKMHILYIYIFTHAPYLIYLIRNQLDVYDLDF